MRSRPRATLRLSPRPDPRAVSPPPPARARLSSVTLTRGWPSDPSSRLLARGGARVGHAALNAALDGVAEDWLGIGSPRWARSSGTDGHLQGLGFRSAVAVKIALRLSIRLRLGCTL